MSELIVRNLTVIAGGSTLVNDVSFTLKPGQLTALVGPNGSGKTSLLRTSLGIEQPASGTSLLDGTDMGGITPILRAQRIAYLPQTRPLAWPNKVRDVVALGRYSHGATLGRLKGNDLRAVTDALKACDLEHLADRRTDTLSGGETARVHFARAFAAEAPLLIADEPIAALDPRHQFRILDLIRSFVDNGGGALVVLHDIELAARYASDMIWMKEGRIVATGTPADTLTSDLLESIYQVRAQVDGFRIQMEQAL